jgi:hypothetical protein
MKAAKEDTEKPDDSKPDELQMTSSQNVESGNPGLRLPTKAGIKAETATADALENTVVAYRHPFYRPDCITCCGATS